MKLLSINMAKNRSKPKSQERLDLFKQAAAADLPRIAEMLEIEGDIYISPNGFATLSWDKKYKLQLEISSVNATGVPVVTPEGVVTIPYDELKNLPETAEVIKGKLKVQEGSGTQENESYHKVSGEIR